MKIRRRVVMTNEASMASTSDIAFLLIIFFMVTSGFVFKDGVQMLLPDKAKKTTIIAKADEITTVAVSAADIKLNDSVVTKEQLESEIKNRIAKKAEEIVLLKFDKDVPYQKVIDLVDVMKVAKVSKLSVKLNEQGEAK